MTNKQICSNYYRWLLKIVCDDYQIKYFSQLLETLYDREFVFGISMDENRACDGVDLRRRFAYEKNMDDILVENALNGPCSVLEMMIALADRCENLVGEVGRCPETGKWFWKMIENMDLENMDDGRFDIFYVQQCIDMLLNREYTKDGRGALFEVPNPPKDLRKVEIWYQMCWYLDSILTF